MFHTDMDMSTCGWYSTRLRRVSGPMGVQSCTGVRKTCCRRLLLCVSFKLYIHRHLYFYRYNTSFHLQCVSPWSVMRQRTTDLMYTCKWPAAWLWHCTYRDGRCLHGIYGDDKRVEMTDGTTKRSSWRCCVIGVSIVVIWPLWAVLWCACHLRRW